MRKQTFQHAEIRDENDNIVNNGAYGKNTALSNKQNDGWIDYVMNNLECLYEQKSSVDTSNFVSHDELTNAISGLASKSSLVGLATTSYVDGRIQHVVGTAPEALDTLGEIATALTENKDKIGTIVNEISTKADKGTVENALMGKAEKADVYTKVDVYTKSESDGKYQLKGNYAELDDFNNLVDGWGFEFDKKADKDNVYTKTESDGKYQAKGAYLTNADVFDTNTIKLPNGARIGVE